MPRAGSGARQEQCRNQGGRRSILCSRNALSKFPCRRRSSPSNPSSSNVNGGGGGSAVRAGAGVRTSPSLAGHGSPQSEFGYYDILEIAESLTLRSTESSLRSQSDSGININSSGRWAPVTPVTPVIVGLQRYGATDGARTDTKVPRSPCVDSRPAEHVQHVEDQHLANTEGQDKVPGTANTEGQDKVPGTRRRRRRRRTLSYNIKCQAKCSPRTSSPSLSLTPSRTPPLGKTSRSFVSMKTGRSMDPSGTDPQPNAGHNLPALRVQQDAKTDAAGTITHANATRSRAQKGDGGSRNSWQRCARTIGPKLPHTHSQASNSLPRTPHATAPATIKLPNLRTMPSRGSANQVSAQGSMDIAKASPRRKKPTRSPLCPADPDPAHPPKTRVQPLLAGDVPWQNTRTR